MRPDLSLRQLMKFKVFVMNRVMPKGFLAIYVNKLLNTQQEENELLSTDGNRGLIDINSWKSWFKFGMKLS